MIRTLRRLVLVYALAVGAGCSATGGGGGPDTAQVTLLQEVADMMRATTQPNGKGPAKLASFNPLRSMYSRGYEAVKSGQVVVLWGAGVKGEEEAAKGGGEVVAYEKDVPTSGGFVLLSSGEVKQMSASEFQSAPKAGKK